jgi:hypothetical protein
MASVSGTPPTWCNGPDDWEDAGPTAQADGWSTTVTNNGERVSVSVRRKREGALDGHSPCDLGGPTRAGADAGGQFGLHLWRCSALIRILVVTTVHVAMATVLSGG